MLYEKKQVILSHKTFFLASFISHLRFFTYFFLLEYFRKLEVRSKIGSSEMSISFNYEKSIMPTLGRAYEY